MTWKDEMADCETAEDFFELFGIEYLPQRMMSVRLHVLEDFNGYLSGIDPDDYPGEELFLAYKKALKLAWEKHAYSDDAIRAKFQNTQGCGSGCNGCS